MIVSPGRSSLKVRNQESNARGSSPSYDAKDQANKVKGPVIVES